MGYRFSRSWYDSGRLVKSNDGRRHRSRCRYVSYYGKQCYCTISGGRCIGSSLCDNYKEKPIPKHSVEPFSLSAKKSYFVTFPSNTKIVMPGKMVRHKKFGFGTVADSDAEYIIVDFYNNGVKKRIKLSFYVCRKYGLLDMYEYK